MKLPGYTISGNLPNNHPHITYKVGKSSGKYSKGNPLSTFPTSKMGASCGGLIVGRASWGPHGASWGPHGEPHGASWGLMGATWDLMTGKPKSGKSHFLHVTRPLQNNVVIYVINPTLRKQNHRVGFLTSWKPGNPKHCPGRAMTLASERSRISDPKSWTFARNRGRFPR